MPNPSIERRRKSRQRENVLHVARTRDRDLVLVEEAHQIGRADAAMTARGPEGHDVSIVDPFFYRAWIDLEQYSDLRGGKQVLGADHFQGHEFLSNAASVHVSTKMAPHTVVVKGKEDTIITSHTIPS